MHPLETIRLLTPADAVAYTIIRREMLADAPWAFARTPDDDPGCNATGLATSLTRPTGYAIAGAFTSDSQRLVAVAGIHRPDPIKIAHCANIWGVYVSPTHRRRGLARSVITTAIQAARAWQVIPRVETISLSVSEKATGAQVLYRAMGFTPWGTEPDALRINNTSFAEIHLQLHL